MTPITAYIGLGSNQGEREQYLADAIKLLEAVPGITLRRASHFYETDPVGLTEQDLFLNMAIRVETTLSPQELLHTLLEVEHQLGRVRDVRWGPRTIDLDLLFYGNRVIEQDDLIVPHPRLRERAFVIVPLQDVVSEQDNLLAGQLEAWRRELGDQGVRRWRTVRQADSQ
ncbi:2-amino-4-hydroxy-6-hydroxymethyldihydropteridine diphosphokinase [Paenibacillus sp. y28]|uniref:2-amino-4-hydroxy-6- hydroxymethyldihydropteridine diphosphokinase n=1 Tax=Paenibacillus sp. y28 TaxID=3129110 RepID=UPI0030475BD0